MKMKFAFLSILMILSSYKVGYSQDNSFFDDVSAMNLRLCFKGYILGDSNSLVNRLPGDITSRKVFLKADSSMKVVVRLNNRTIIPVKPMQEKSSSGIGYSQSMAPAGEKSKTNKLLFRKFGATSGFVAVNNKASTTSDDYILTAGAVLFAKSGMLTIEVFHKDELLAKFNEKRFINFASNFIRFNN